MHRVFSNGQENEADKIENEDNLRESRLAGWGKGSSRGNAKGKDSSLHDFKYSLIQSMSNSAIAVLIFCYEPFSVFGTNVIDHKPRRDGRTNVRSQLNNTYVPPGYFVRRASVASTPLACEKFALPHHVISLWRCEWNATVTMT